MSEYINTCIDAARAGGEVLRQWQGRIQAREKGPRDLVSEADLASQQEIRRLVLGRFPGHEFLGEEDDNSESAARSAAQHHAGGAYRWIVDPLDGTTNYVHGLPNYAVSVGLEHQGRVIAGAVYDPVADECFTAALGEGAALDGRPIGVSQCARLDQSLLAASFSANVPRDSEEVRRFVEVLHASRALRRLGSAALNLCYVAAGRLDGYWATSVKIWDVAAGTLILSEAGGTLRNVEGGPFELETPLLACTSTDALMRELLDALRRAVAA
jgi:myo-inositol-1(or 4)-monophosphatase